MGVRAFDELERVRGHQARTLDELWHVLRWRHRARVEHDWRMATGSTVHAVANLEAAERAVDRWARGVCDAWQGISVTF